MFGSKWNHELDKVMFSRGEGLQAMFAPLNKQRPGDGSLMANSFFKPTDLYCKWRFQSFQRLKTKTKSS